MTYVIAEPCVDVLDRAYVEEYPVDCSHDGSSSAWTPIWPSATGHH